MLQNSCPTAGSYRLPGRLFPRATLMHTFGSGILPFVGRDAAYLFDHIDRLEYWRRARTEVLGMKK